MAAEILTPSCKVTGLPLPISPLEPQYEGVLSIPGYKDEHHAFHPEKHPLLRGVGGMAVRNCRIQEVVFAMHHYGYNEIFMGPELPDNEDDMFRVSVLAAAGVVPRQAIKINSPTDHEIIDLDDEQHEEISKSIRVDQTPILSRFFAQYASKQKIEHRVDMITIEQLLDYNTSHDVKRKLASEVLGAAVKESVRATKLPETHEMLKEEGFFAGKKPETPYTIAKRFVRRRHLQYFGELIAERFAMA